MQIHILGNVCSGKTHLAKKLAQKFQLEYFSLDEISFKNNHSKRTEKEINDKIQELVKKKNRISEGIFINEKWAQILIENTEKVYILKVNPIILLARVFKRNFELRKKKTPESFEHFLKMLKYALFYNKKILKEYKSQLQQIGIDYKEVKGEEDIIKDLQ